MSLRHGISIGLLALSGLPAIAQLTITNSSPLPYGSLNSAYSVQLSATGGSANYTYRLAAGAGNLPPSLGLSSGGLISGTLTAAGTYNFTVNVISGSASGSKAFSIGVPQITTPSPLPSGVINNAYSLQFQYSDGPNSSPSWGISAAPPGLSIDSTTGVLSGIPTSTGTYTFIVRADEGAPFGNNGVTTLVATKAFSLNISSSGSSSLTISTPSLASGATGQSYSQTVIATGGSPPYSFTATGLPMGLKIANSGGITGTPGADGNYTVVVTVTDSKSNQISRSFPLVINSSLTIVTTSLNKGSNGQSYFHAISVTGGTPPYVFSGSGFPSGLAITSAGNISGTPSQTGTFAVEIDVTDAVKHFASAQFSLIISTLPSISTSSPLPVGSPGTAYSQTFAATGGLAPYNFFILPTGASNPLPPGLTLAKTGALSGTPTASGVYTFTVQVVDANQNSGTKSFQLTIGQSTQSLTVSPLSLQFSGPSGGDVPGGQNVVISNSGALAHSALRLTMAMEALRLRGLKLRPAMAPHPALSTSASSLIRFLPEPIQRESASDRGR